ncbi:MAG: DUF1707 SHOCT-like domain-containing protein [Mycobacteriaceae bacterium]|uniref:DUF1707 SHOCT-like domain-containing protein n=1 Tax=Corynebacterium sp. TaxID=1720 RepID=UPI003F943F52
MESPDSAGDRPGDRIRLSDNDRIHALKVLGGHYADGRLDDAEFNDRSAGVAASRTLGDVRGYFDDLPGGVPFDSSGRAVAVPGQDAPSGGVEGTLDPADPADPVDRVDPEKAELESLHKRGELVQTIDAVVLGVTLVSFLVLQFIVDVSWAWVVWPSLVVTLTVPRMLLKWSDEDEELYEEISEADSEKRKERLRRAAERMHELEPGEPENGDKG